MTAIKPSGASDRRGDCYCSANTVNNEMVSTGDADLVSTYDLPDSEPTGGGGEGIPE